MLRSTVGVAEQARRILTNYRTSQAQHMSKDKDKGSSETDEPWKAPQPPDSKSPPKRNVDRDYGANKAQTT